MDFACNNISYLGSLFLQLLLAKEKQWLFEVRFSHGFNIKSFDINLILVHEINFSTARINYSHKIIHKNNIRIC